MAKFLSIKINAHFDEKWEGGKMLEQIEKTMYKVAIYIRLSKENVDRRYDESESIKNQRILLTKN